MSGFPFQAKEKEAKTMYQAATKTAPAHLKAARQVANVPRWKKGWTDAKGNAKAGFWYVLVDGSRKALTAYFDTVQPVGCTGKKGTKQEQQAARDARDKFLAMEAAKAFQDHAAAEQANILTIADVLAPYRKQASKQQERYLKPFVEGREQGKGTLPFKGLGSMPFDQLAPKHHTAWESVNPNWGKASFNRSVCAIKAAIYFAMSADGGHIIAVNPLAGVKRKKDNKRKAWLKSAAEEQAIRSQCDECFDLWLSCMLETACRPMELGKLTTEHIEEVDGDLVWVLQPNEWKCGAKTEECRFIHLNPRWEQHSRNMMLKAEAAGKPLSLFVAKDGKPWTVKRLGDCFTAAKEAALAAGHKVDEELVCYSLRHTAITRMIQRGIPVAMIAEAAGTSIAMIKKHYDHAGKPHSGMKAALAALYSA